MLKKHLLFCVVILTGFLACSEPSLFLDYRHFEGSWPAAEKVVFPLDSLTDQPVNMMIHIRNNPRYPFSNLFLIARLKAGDSLLVCDTLEYAMATPQGAWLGSGFLEVKESKLWWKEKYKLPLANGLQVELEHALRFNGIEQATDPLEGIVSVGFAVEEILKDE
jgi:gliding motility-associated lipoprotein GldH